MDEQFEKYFQKIDDKVMLSDTKFCIRNAHEYTYIESLTKSIRNKGFSSFAMRCDNKAFGNESYKIVYYPNKEEALWLKIPIKNHKGEIIENVRVDHGKVGESLTMGRYHPIRIEYEKELDALQSLLVDYIENLPNYRLLIATGLMEIEQKE